MTTYKITITYNDISKVVETGISKTHMNASVVIKDKRVIVKTEKKEYVFGGLRQLLFGNDADDGVIVYTPMIKMELI